jgi:hypothetical protein
VVVGEVAQQRLGFVHVGPRLRHVAGLAVVTIAARPPGSSASCMALIMSSSDTVWLPEVDDFESTGAYCRSPGVCPKTMSST